MALFNYRGFSGSSKSRNFGISREIPMQCINEIAEKIVSELFADGKTPMEQFGINWEQAERLERDIPQIVIPNN
jgi:hypothetical protein